MPDLARLRALCDAAVPGPWHYVQGYGFSFHPSGDGPATPSTDFVCAAREALPALVDEVTRLRIVEAAAREALDEIAVLVPEVEDSASGRLDKLLRCCAVARTCLTTIGHPDATQPAAKGSL